MQAKNVKREIPAHHRAVLDLRQGSAARPVSTKRAPRQLTRGGRGGSRRAAIQEGR